MCARETRYTFARTSPVMMSDSHIEGQSVRGSFTAFVKGVQRADICRKYPKCTAGTGAIVPYRGSGGQGCHM